MPSSKRTSSKKSTSSAANSDPTSQDLTSIDSSSLEETDKTSEPAPVLPPEQQVERLLEEGPGEFSFPGNLNDIDRMRVVISYLEPAKTCIFDPRSKSWVGTKPTNLKTPLDQLNPDLPENRLTLMALAIHQIKQEMLEIAKNASPDE